MSLVVDFKIRRRLTGYCFHDHAQEESWCIIYKAGGDMELIFSANIIIIIVLLRHAFKCLL